ncbi:unnamed protein product [marine sediment metagenome]|uniref:Uncharacterized protein n=1 Tax=marine sediment metagenome TaxID=412755 RepID=X1LGH8_9ZZZZ
MNIKELIEAIENSDMEQEAKAEIAEILQDYEYFIEVKANVQRLLGITT